MNKEGCEQRWVWRLQNSRLRPGLSQVFLKPPELALPLQVWLRQTRVWALAGLRAVFPSVAASLLPDSQKHPFLSKPVSFKQEYSSYMYLFRGGRLQELAPSLQCRSWGSNLAASILIHRALLLALRFFLSCWICPMCVGVHAVARVCRSEDTLVGSALSFCLHVGPRC